MVEGQRIKSLQSFRTYVTSYEYPVIVLFRKKNCSQCDKVERRLKRALVRTRGKFRLCLIDSGLIDEQLRSAFNIHYTPSLFLFYRSNIAQEYRGKPSKDQLKEFVTAAQFFHVMTTEEQLLT